MNIREVKIDDAGELSEIYKYYVDNFPYSFEYIAPTIDEFAKRIVDIAGKFPFFVCEDNNEILGFTYGMFMKWTKRARTRRTDDEQEGIRIQRRNQPGRIPKM